jgi:hypothetical protein
MTPRSLRVLVGGTLVILAGTILAPTAAAKNFPETVDLPNGWQPEGITSSATTAYVGSLATGAIWSIDLKSGSGHVLVPGAAGRVAVGVEYDTRSGRLWVAGGPTGRVSAYDARTGALLADYQFAAPVGFINDLVVTDNAVYATDSNVQQLLVIPLGPGGALPAPSAAFELALGGDISYGPGFNANGIVAGRNRLILVQSNTGLLFSVDPATGVADAIDLGGASVLDGDGLELVGDTLFVGRNVNEVDVFRMGPHFASARQIAAVHRDSFDTPTTLTYAAGRLWVVNARFSTTPTAGTPYWLTRLP